MGAVFASAARAPITAVIIIFELTGDYHVILPLMFAVVLATALSNAITRDTIYTLKLRRRGIEIDQPDQPSRMAQITVAEAMGNPPRPLQPRQPLGELLARFGSERTNTLPVADDAGKLLGVIATSDLERTLTRDANGQPITAATLMREAPTLRAPASLEQAILALGATDDEALPVIAPNDDRLIGWLTHRRVLDAYRARLNGQGHDESGQ